MTVMMPTSATIPVANESLLAVVFARVLALDIRGIQKNLACDLEVETTLCKDGVVLDRVPRKAVLKVKGLWQHHTPQTAYTQ